MGLTVKARVLVIDGHAMVRQGLAHIINLQPDLEVCGECSTFQTGISTAQKLNPDLILSEITLGTSTGTSTRSGSGLEMIKSLATQRPELPVLVVTTHEESMYAELAMRWGAMGYIMKTEPADRLLSAMRRVLQGKPYLSENMMFQMIRHRVGAPRKSNASVQQILSDRELQVFQMIGQWRGTRDIAKELHLSIKTIEYYRGKIKEKLGLQKGRDLTRVATERAGTEGAEPVPRQAADRFVQADV